MLLEGKLIGTDACFCFDSDFDSLLDYSPLGESLQIRYRLWLVSRFECLRFLNGGLHQREAHILHGISVKGPGTKQDVPMGKECRGWQ